MEILKQKTVMTTTSEKKFNEALSYLVVILNVDTNNDRHIFILSRAIRYADLDFFYPKPINTKESILNEIFSAKASSYFKRKNLNPREDSMKIDRIKSNEYAEVKNLEMKLPLKIVYLKNKNDKRI